MIDYEIMSDNSVVLISKLPSFLVKAILNGAVLSFIMSGSVINNRVVICVALRIYDDPDKPITLYHVLHNQKDFEAFGMALGQESNRLHLFDELCRHVLEVGIRVSNARTSEVFQRFLSLAPKWEELGKELEEMALDSFSTDMELIWEGYKPTAMVWEEIALEVTSWGEPTTTYMINSGQKIGPFQIVDSDEGGSQEQTAHQLLDYVYGEKSYRSPILGAAQNQRELTDILAVGDDHLILIESKALSMLGKNPSTEANARNIMKDIKKGIRQISGAAKEIRLGSKIVSLNGEAIQLPTTEVIIGIALISHMHPDLNWEWVAQQVEDMALKKNICLHVMDVMELFRIASISRDNSGYFLANLIVRWKAVLQNGSALVESRLGSGQ